MRVNIARNEAIMYSLHPHLLSFNFYEHTVVAVHLDFFAWPFFLFVLGFLRRPLVRNICSLSFAHLEDRWCRLTSICRRWNRIWISSQVVQQLDFYVLAALTRKVRSAWKREEKGWVVEKVASKELRWRGAWNRVCMKFSIFFYLMGKGVGLCSAFALATRTFCKLFLHSCNRCASFIASWVRIVAKTG